jgi:DNA-directed RNA polymerase
MSTFNTIETYLTDELSKIVLDSNKKQNRGFVVLKTVIEESEQPNALRNIIAASVNSLMHLMVSSRNESLEKGEALLTNTISILGVLAASTAGFEMPDRKDQIHLGAAIITAFWHAKAIRIVHTYAVKEYPRGVYKIVLEPCMGELPSELPEENLLPYTSLNPIRDVESVLQSTDLGACIAVVKGVNNANATSQTSEHIESYMQSIQDKDDWIAALNVLQQQGWKINEEVLSIVEKADIIEPIKHNAFTKEHRAKRFKDAEKEYLKSQTPENEEEYNEAAEKWEEELAILRNNSKSAAMKMILKKANVLKDEPAFYQYVDVDYRGRYYYKEPFLNFQGNDLARSLMLFEEGTTLDEDGVRWLFIHAANCHNQSYDIADIPEWTKYDYKSALEAEGLDSISLDKMTLHDRMCWTAYNIEKIVADSHQLPSEKIEKPFSYLAACIEIRKWMADPEGYVCHLPVAIDGTCNGYQHSAAIAKDELTGSLVALEASEIPTDLYVQVAKKLVERLPEFFETREMPMKHIRKYITKRGTMTRAYSAGAGRISENMMSDLVQDQMHKRYDIKKTDCDMLSKELVACISEVCPGATKTMEWLQTLADYEIGQMEAYDWDGQVWTPKTKKKVHSQLQKLKKKKEKTLDDEIQIELLQDRLAHVRDSRTLKYGNDAKFIHWITPAGFPVFYHSHYTREDSMKLSLKGVEIEGKKSNQIELALQIPVDAAMKHDIAKGISPNYIHSYDSAHMAKTIMNYEGVFGAIHDSFSTHPNDVDVLARATREQFVDMYEVDNMFYDMQDNILSESTASLMPPAQGNLNVHNVLNSTYFFA